MPLDADSRAMLKKANEQEGKHEWLEAAKSYEKLLSSKQVASSLAAETWERIGFCYNWASRQTEDLDGFKKLRQLSVEAYKSAAKLFEKEDSLKNQGKSAQCKAIAEYVCSWLASNSSEKRKMLDECIEFGKKSLEAFEKADDKLNYGKMCNDLLLSP